MANIANSKNVIKTILNPTIELEEMSFIDIEEGTNKVSNYYKRQMEQGDLIPMIKINNHIIETNELIKFTIDCTEFLPRISIRFRLANSGSFASVDVPKEDDIINVFIRSRDDVYKPIRNDYVITDAQGSESGTDKQNSTFSISGVLYIPGILDSVSLMKEGTSFNVLYEIAEEIGLGFSTNEDNTEDEQKWICAHSTYLDFIRDICESSWKNENSFFNCFIDVYYTLNFVNVNSLFESEDAIEDALLDNLFTHDNMEDSDIPKEIYKNILTNREEYSDTVNKIDKFRIVNKSSRISDKYGYKLYGYFYDHETLEDWNIYTEALTTEGSEEHNILLKGKAHTNIQNNKVKRKWLGVQYTDNTHNNHKYAQIHNMINLAELEKINTHVIVPRVNFTVYKYKRIPVVILNEGDIEKIAKTGDDDDMANGWVVDKFYSGYYIINGFIIEYRDRDKHGNLGSFTQKLILTRREWPIP